jgi:DNA-binding MarR family transcriptional regulator
VRKGIQSEIKQTKPFHDLEEEAFIALLRTADQLQQALGELLKPYGLSPTQLNALRILRGAGNAGLACSEVGARMINHDPDITRLLDRLGKRNLVGRGRDEADRRVITARITREGLDLLKRLDRPLEEFHHRLLAPLGPVKLRVLLKLLETTRNP